MARIWGSGFEIGDLSDLEKSPQEDTTCILEVILTNGERQEIGACIQDGGSLLCVFLDGKGRITYLPGEWEKVVWSCQKG